MFTRLEFTNFRALRSASLDLGPINILIGPNGSGKTTVLKAIEVLYREGQSILDHLITRRPDSGGASVRFKANFPEVQSGMIEWRRGSVKTGSKNGGAFSGPFQFVLPSIQFYELAPREIAREVKLKPGMTLGTSGSGLAGVLTNLRDENEERFDQMRAALSAWIPEFDSIQFQTLEEGGRSFGLRQASTKAMIPATELSEGTLFALVLLYLAYQPNPPAVLCLEEPDRGIHPRLLRDVRDALYRLAYPKENGLDREPTQIIATTHSPYFLDLFRDHPEAVIVAEKHVDGSATFRNLSSDAQLREIIGESPLGEAWYSGVLGGVPAR